MELTKFTHACVRLEKDGEALLVDPGIWTEPEAYDGVGAILVTHEHADHLDVDRVRDSGLPVWTNAGVAAALGDEAADRVTVVEAGQSFEATGFAVDAVGNDHAIILPELGVPCQNTAYLIEDAVFHPGDSFTRPDRAVHTLLVPLSGPWHVMADAVGFVREVDAEQSIGIHDGLLNERGLMIGKNWIGGQTKTPYNPLTPGETVFIP